MARKKAETKTEAKVENKAESVDLKAIDVVEVRWFNDSPDVDLRLGERTISFRSGVASVDPSTADRLRELGFIE